MNNTGPSYVSQQISLTEPTDITCWFSPMTLPQIIRGEGVSYTGVYAVYLALPAGENRPVPFGTVCRMRITPYRVDSDTFVPWGYSLPGVVQYGGALYAFHLTPAPFTQE